MKNSGWMIGLCMASLILLFTGSANLSAQKKSAPAPKDPVEASHLNALKFRSIGPAIASGRIADIVVNPKNTSEYYVGVASGGLWKTTNKGTTYEPVFDNQPVFSIGCIAVDPVNPNVVWVGTGENNSQRNLAYGDGVYKSLDAGKTWKNMGLKKSEHIGEIMIDPRNTDVVYVCAQGPAWGPGGDRGLYKTTDGGETWEAILTVGQYTGISDMEMDPRNPDVLYASAHMRERRVYSKINGGPESAIYKSTDAGKTWKKLTRGLPGGDVGRIGLALSPANPDVIYATIELPEGRGGFYRSVDQGESWERRSDEISSSPQYYQELVADPADVDRVILLDVRNMVSDDGGATWEPVGERNKHVDNHALWIDPKNTDYYLAGCDGGVYESWDRGQHWIFKANLPITQFYHVRVDDRYPFYNVYGGAQDNGCWFGPSQTEYRYMINEDWTYTNGGDGYVAAPEPGNPDISYASSQYGGMVRFDNRTGTTVSIKPQPLDDKPLRFNWNTPYFVSPHNATTLYAAANVVFKSTDRGDSWKVISPDLTRQLNVNELPMMGKIWPPEAVAKNASTSPFGNIFALAESPLKAGLLYAGTDDGLIQVSENDGESWTRYDRFPGVPDMTFVNYLLPSQHDVNVVYAAFDGRKNFSDFTPYLLKSNDRGKTWTSIASDLPAGTVYVIQEDPVDPDLLFAGTEWGVYVSLNGGGKWFKIKNGLPTIQVKDLAIQKRENDLAVGTFGRGFYILDDYSYLRELNEENLKKDAYIFGIKDALIFFTASRMSNQGEVIWRADNPGSEANFTYLFNQEIKTLKQVRKEKERAAEKAGKNIFYPSDEELLAEQEQENPSLIFTIYDGNDQIVNRITAPARKGINRVSWDLRYASPGRSGRFYRSFGATVPPGTYSVSMSKMVDGVITPLTGKKTFQVKLLENQTLPTADQGEKASFMKKAYALNTAINAAVQITGDMQSRLSDIRQTLMQSPVESADILKKIEALDQEISGIMMQFNGSPLRIARQDLTEPTLRGRIGFVLYATAGSTHGVTGSQREQFGIAENQFKPLLEQIRQLSQQAFPELEKMLDEAGVPWTEGRFPVLDY